MKDEKYYCKYGRRGLNMPIIWSILTFFLFERFEAEWFRTLLVLFLIIVWVAWAYSIHHYEELKTCPFK